MMKTKTLAAAMVLMLGVLTGCSGAPSSELTDKASGNGRNKHASLSSCMRDKGYDMPDPDSGSRVATLSAPEGIDTDQWRADLEKCLGDAGGAAGSPQKAKPFGSPGQLRKVAGCIRENGFSDYPDDERGQMNYKPSDAEVFADAESKCWDEVLGTGTGTGSGTEVSN